MSCDCIDKTIPALTLKNTSLVVALSFTGECDKVILATEPIEKKRGRKALTLVAIHCPFCGKKYTTPKGRAK